MYPWSTVDRHGFRPEFPMERGVDKILTKMTMSCTTSRLETVQPGVRHFCRWLLITNMPVDPHAIGLVSATGLIHLDTRAWNKEVMAMRILR